MLLVLKLFHSFKWHSKVVAHLKMFAVQWERKNHKRWTLKWTFYYCGLFVQIELNYRHSILAFLVFGLIPFIAGVLEQSAVPRAWRRYQDVSSRRTCLGSVMVWAGWSSDPLSEDHRPYAAAVPPPSEFLLVHDICVSTSWIGKPMRKPLMTRPARSPNLNPIKHLWDIMYRCSHCRYVVPQAAEELTDALIKRTQETISHVPWSTFGCCSERILAYGGCTLLSHIWEYLQLDHPLFNSA